MAQIKRIQIPWSETGVTLYAVIQRQSDNYFLNDADGAFAAAPSDKYVSFTENSVTLGLYEIEESRTVWTNGDYTVTAYKQLGGSPALATDLICGVGEMVMVDDHESTAGVSGVATHRNITIEWALTRVRVILNDPDKELFPDSDLIPWWNSGQREVVRLRPDSLSERTIITLVAGVAQSVSGMAFIKPARNMGTNGATAGAVPRIITEEQIDAIIPDWPTHTASATVKFVILHPLDPKKFFTYPPQAATPGTLEILQSVYPVDVPVLYSSTDLISLDDVYANTLIEYVAYRALDEMTEEGDTQRALAHKNLFAASLGVGVKDVAG